MILKLNFSCDLCSLYRDSNEKQQVCTNVLINLIQHKNIAKRIYIYWTEVLRCLMWFEK